MASDVTPTSDRPIKSLTFNDLTVTGGDINFDCFKIQFESIKYEKFETFDFGYYFPVVNAWIMNIFQNMFVDLSFNVEFIETMYHGNKFPVNFCRLLDTMIKSRFSKTVLVNFDPAYNGIQLYHELYTSFSINNFEVLDRLMLLKKFTKNVLEHGSNYKEFNDHVTIMSYYFVNIKDLIPYYTLFNTTAEKIDNIITRSNLSNYSEFENVSHRKLITQIKKFDAIKSYDSEEINYVKANKFNNNNVSNTKNDFRKNVKCYICHKFRHTGPECSKYDPNKDKKRFEPVQYIELPGQSTVYYSETDNGHSNPEEIFLISETPFISDSGSSCHLATDRNLLTNVHPSATTVKGIDNIEC